MKATVWTVQIQHKYEETLAVYGSKAEARACLRNFLADNWQHMREESIPDDLDLAATIYFDRRPDESCSMIEHEIEIHTEMAHSSRANG